MIPNSNQEYSFKLALWEILTICQYQHCFNIDNARQTSSVRELQSVQVHRVSGSMEHVGDALSVVEDQLRSRFDRYASGGNLSEL